MEQITLGGIDIATLKAQQKAVRKDASKFIADTIKQATEVVGKILEAETEEDVESLSAKALELLGNAKLVSDVSGVEYYLPYNEPYDDGNALSDQLESFVDEFESGDIGVYGDDSLSALYELLQEMEHDSFTWNSSSIGC